jgi:hypothetical protein
MPTYSDLLLSTEWKNKRTEIIKRDKLCCLNCNNKNVISNLKVSQALLMTNPTNNHVGFFLINREMFKLKTRIKCFIDSRKAFWRYDFPNKNIIIYYDDLVENNTVRLILAREIMNEEINRIDDTIIVLDPIKKPDNSYWIFNNSLHVHHTYYQLGKNPWEYPNNSLTTLCWICHEELHSDKLIPVLDFEGNEIKKYTPCFRCHGAGEFPEYRHVENGICFRCNGAKYEELI